MQSTESTMRWRRAPTARQSDSLAVTAVAILALFSAIQIAAAQSQDSFGLAARATRADRKTDL